MDDDQQRAVDLALSGKSFFLTGAGGTGKSYTIRSIIDSLNKQGKDVALTAMTGCASILLGKGAKTLHSWAGIGLGKETVDVILQKLKKSFKAKKGWQSADTLIIDEISMMTPDLLDKLDLIGKAILRSEKPFGGIQLILVGDMYQLPPVNKENPSTFFVFESQTWKNVIHDAELTYEVTTTQRARIRIVQVDQTQSMSKLMVEPFRAPCSERVCRSGPTYQTAPIDSDASTW